jgi:DNA-binding MarR family transcriptional regulator
MPKRRKISKSKKELIVDLLSSGREMSGRIILFHQALASQFGLNATDYKCLDIAKHEATVTAGRLAELTGLTTGAITAALDRLEHAGFVRRERDGTDRRKVIVHILPGGQAKLGPFFAKLAGAMTALHEEYTSDELALILDYQCRCVAILERETKALGKNRAGDRAAQK